MGSFVEFPESRALLDVERVISLERIGDGEHRVVAGNQPVYLRRGDGDALWRAIVKYQAAERAHDRAHDAAIEAVAKARTGDNIDLSEFNVGPYPVLAEFVRAELAGGE